MDDINPFDDARPSSVSDNHLRLISSHANRMRWLQEEIAAVEDRLKQLKEQLRLCQEVELPEAMDSVGMADFSLSDGTMIGVKGLINVSIRKDKRPVAYQWIREQGHGGIIKTEISLSFGKGEDNRAQEVIRALRESGLNPTLEEGIHPQTLQSWAKEMVQGGKALPEELFSVFTGRKAVVVK